MRIRVIKFSYSPSEVLTSVAADMPRDIILQFGIRVSGFRIRDTGFEIQVSEFGFKSSSCSRLAG